MSFSLFQLSRHVWFGSSLATLTASSQSFSWIEEDIQLTSSVNTFPPFEIQLKSFRLENIHKSIPFTIHSYFIHQSSNNSLHTLCNTPVEFLGAYHSPNGRSMYWSGHQQPRRQKPSSWGTVPCWSCWDTYWCSLSMFSFENLSDSESLKSD